MNNNHKSKETDILCPFFRKNGNNNSFRQIACEGIVYNSTIRLCFQNHKDFYFHLDNYCCKNYNYCEIYRLLMENKYPDD